MTWCLNPGGKKDSTDESADAMSSYMPLRCPGYYYFQGLQHLDSQSILFNTCTAHSGGEFDKRPVPKVHQGRQDQLAELVGLGLASTIKRPSILLLIFVFSGETNSGSSSTPMGGSLWMELRNT